MQKMWLLYCLDPKEACVPLPDRCGGYLGSYAQVDDESRWGEGRTHIKDSVYFHKVNVIEEI